MNYIKHDKISPISEKMIGVLKAMSKHIGKKLGDSHLVHIKSEFIMPKFIMKRNVIKQFQVHKHDVVTMEPEEITNNKHILFFHGGAYVAKGIKVHWKFLETLAHSLNCKATYVDYPLAPEFGYKDTHAMVNATYDELVATYQDDEFIFMGDSAGGGLALAFAQSLAQNNHKKQPKKIVMFSPWLDLTMENEDIAEYEELDITLSKEKLLNSACAYAQGEDLSLPQLSPINGKLDGLCEMEMYVGTHELMCPDCLKFNDLAKEKGATITTYVYEKMPHDWVIMPFEEAKIATRSVIDGIRQL